MKKCNEHRRAFEELIDMIQVFKGIGREIEEESEEYGRVYMHAMQLQYGGAGFDSNTTYGQCEQCGQGIPVKIFFKHLAIWRYWLHNMHSRF